MKPCISLTISSSCNPRAREGRDRSSSGGSKGSKSCNPRAREGRDQNQRLLRQIERLVAIRAPAKGATLRGSLSPSSGLGCNPRAREGRDTMGRTPRTKDEVLQSARPRRARPIGRLLTGRLLAVAIRAPAKGATLCRRQPRARGHRCNPRAREGRDPYDVESHLRARSELQSARPRRARPILGFYR